MLPAPVDWARVEAGAETTCIVADVFLDTNILAYQFDASEPEKQETARRLLTTAGHTFVVSTQVLLELFTVTTRKLRPPLPVPAARVALERLSSLTVVPADADLVLRAAGTAADHGLSIWDAMILEAAVLAGCDELWTEDLASGATLRGVRVVDPFATP